MKKLMTILAAASVLQVAAQKVTKPDAYAKTITAEDLKKHLYTVASPEMEGRETGTAGQRKAAAYIESYFKSLGLKPGAGEGFQLPYSIYQDSVTAAAITINGKSYELDKDFTANATNLQATMKLSEVVMVGSGITADGLKNAELGGKLVMLFGSLSQSLLCTIGKKISGGGNNGKQ